MENMVPQPENPTPPDGREVTLSRCVLRRLIPGATHMCRSSEAHNLLLVIPEGMADPEGIRRTRLSLIAEKEPGAYRGSLDASAYEVTPTL
jgi:hypothetical protein